MVPECRPPAVPGLDRVEHPEVGDAGGERSFPSVPGSLLISVSRDSPWVDSAPRPASADMAAIAQAVSVPTMAGKSSNARSFDGSVAASGQSIANQYTA